MFKAIGRPIIALANCKAKKKRQAKTLIAANKPDYTKYAGDQRVNNCKNMTTKMPSEWEE